MHTDQWMFEDLPGDRMSTETLRANQAGDLFDDHESIVLNCAFSHDDG